MLQQLKYQNYIEKLGLDGKCPPQYAKQLSIEGCRFVRGKINDPQNFLPQGIKLNEKKSTIKRGIRNKPDEICKRFIGLSFYNSIEGAINFWNSCPHKKLLKYTHIAVGPIRENDGICIGPNRNGHFTLFEYIEANLNKSFKVVKDL